VARLRKSESPRLELYVPPERQRLLERVQELDLRSRKRQAKAFKTVTDSKYRSLSAIMFEALQEWADRHEKYLR